MSEPEAPRVSTSELLEYTDFWRELLGEKGLQEAFVSRAQEKDFVEVLKLRPFAPAEAWLHLIAVRETSDQDYRKRIASILKERTRDEWFGSMKSESGLVEIVAALAGTNIGLGQGFLDALKLHAEWRLSQSGKGCLSSEWQKLIEQLSGAAQDAFQQALWNCFWQEKGNIAGLLPYYDGPLSKSVLDHGPEDALKRLEQIVDRKDVSEIEWLEKTLIHWEPTAKHAKGTRANLLERARQGLADETDDNKKAAFERLCKVLTHE